MSEEPSDAARFRDVAVAHHFDPYRDYPFRVETAARSTHLGEESS